MKKTSPSISAQVSLRTLLLLAGVGLLCAIPGIDTRAQNPTSGSVGPSPGGATANWDQTTTTPGGGVNTEMACVDGVNCEVFNLTVTGVPADWTGQRVQVQLTWASSGNEFDIYIRKGMNNTSGAIVTQAMNGPGLTSQTAYIDVAANGTGVYTIHVVPDTTPVVTDKYHGNARAVPITPAPPPPAPQDTGLKIGYENFEVPGVLTPVTVTTGPTVEYMGR